MKQNARRKTAAPADDPHEKPYPGYAREKAAMEERVALANRAAAAPLPGPLREAFAGRPPVVHGFTLQPVRMSMVPVLVELQSPLLVVVRILREELARADGADESTPDLAAKARAARIERSKRRMLDEIPEDHGALVETVFAFVRPAAEIRAALDMGRKHFREQAMRQVADQLTAAQFGELQAVVSEWYLASFATVVQYEARKADDGTVFTPPPASRTDSAGG